MGYLLDITTLLEVLRASPPPKLVRRLSSVPGRERFTSVITVSQLLLAARRRDDARLMQEVVRLVSSIRVAPYDLASAQAFAKLRATEAAEAETDDVMVAAIAISRELTLVTRRAAEFKGFSRLRVEDWIGG